MNEDVGTGVGPSERAHHAGAGGPTPERRRRMSARRKQDAVLRLLRGEDLELLARQLGVTAADLSGWRGAFLAAGKVSLKTRPADARDALIGAGPRLPVDVFTGRCNGLSLSKGVLVVLAHQVVDRLAQERLNADALLGGQHVHRPA